MEPKLESSIQQDERSAQALEAIRTDLTRRSEKNLKAVKAVLSMWQLAQRNEAPAPTGKVKNENHSRLVVSRAAWLCMRALVFVGLALVNLALLVHLSEKAVRLLEKMERPTSV